MGRTGLHYDLAALANSVAVPTLFILGSEERGSALPEPERSAVADAQYQGMGRVFDAGHGVHREIFDCYVRLLGGWLGGPP